MAISNVQFGSNLRPSTVDVMNVLNAVVNKINDAQVETVLWNAPANFDISQGYGYTLSDNFTNYEKLKIIPYDKDGFILPTIEIPNPANGVLFTCVDLYAQNPYMHVKGASFELKNGNMIEFVKGYLDQWMTGEATIGGGSFGYNFQIGLKQIIGISK